MVHDGDVSVFDEGVDALFVVGGASDAAEKHFVVESDGDVSLADAVVSDFPD